VPNNTNPPSGGQTNGSSNSFDWKGLGKKVAFGVFLFVAITLTFAAVGESHRWGWLVPAVICSVYAAYRYRNRTGKFQMVAVAIPLVIALSLILMGFWFTVIVGGLVGFVALAWHNSPKVRSLAQNGGNRVATPFLPGGALRRHPGAPRPSIGKMKKPALVGGLILLLAACVLGGYLLRGAGNSSTSVVAAVSDSAITQQQLNDAVKKATDDVTAQWQAKLDDLQKKLDAKPNLPVVNGNTPVLGDTTGQADTPPVASKELRDKCGQLASWNQLYNCMKDQQWYINGVNQMKQYNGFDWSDVQKWAGEGVDARTIQVFNMNISDTDARNAVRGLVGNAANTLPIVRNGNMVNTMGLEHNSMTPFVDNKPQVRVSLTPLAYDSSGVAHVNLSSEGGIFIDCLNDWGKRAPAPTPVVYTVTNKPPPPTGGGCTEPHGCLPPPPPPVDNCTAHPQAPECQPPVDDCKAHPNKPECKPPVDDCKKHPEKPECKPPVDCTTPGHENDEGCKPDCEANPEAPECNPPVDCTTPGHENDEGCKPDCTTPGHENDEGCKPDCETNPEAPECQPEPEKCDGITLDEICGTPNDGGDQQDPQDNDPALVAPTPGYTPGDAEETLGNQTTCDLVTTLCGLDPSVDGTGVEGSEDGGFAPGGDVTVPVPGGTDGSGGDNPNASGEPVWTNTDQGTSNDADSTEANNEGSGTDAAAGSDPFGSLSLQNVVPDNGPAAAQSEALVAPQALVAPATVLPTDLGSNTESSSFDHSTTSATVAEPKPAPVYTSGSQSGVQASNDVATAPVVAPAQVAPASTSTFVPSAADSTPTTTHSVAPSVSSVVPSTVVAPSAVTLPGVG
jgi:hypothetical protein